MIVKSKLYYAIILFCILSTLLIISYISDDGTSLMPSVTKPEDLQFREVLEITVPDDAAYEEIQMTEITPGDEIAYKSYEDQEIILVYEIEEGEALKVRLGPTRLTGDAIASAYAAVDDQGGYKIVFEITEADFILAVGRKPCSQEEFRRFCELSEKGFCNDHIDWDIVYNCAAEEIEK